MKIISLSPLRVNFYLFLFVYYITKNTLTLEQSKISLDEVKYHFGASQNITCEANITPKTPNSLFQRFLRFFRRA